MAILHRKLLPGEVEPGGNSVYTCTFTDDCDDSNVNPHCLRCVYISPPPPPVRQKSPENHLIPYLISAVCALGVAFLILTTCMVLLRRGFRRRRNPPAGVATDGETVFVDEDHGPVVDHPIWHIVTVGLQQSVIDSITSFKYKKSDRLIEGNDCSVCLTDFEDGDHLRLLPKCSHAFHLPCIDTWLRSHKNCPLCRAPVVNHSSPLNFTVLRPNSGEMSPSGDTQVERSENHGGSEGDQAGQRRDRADDFDTLPVEGIRIAEVLKRNRENRMLSDLGENCRIMAEDFQPVRRSISLDSSAASAISNAVVANGEGSSKQPKRIEVEKEAGNRVRRDSGMSGLMKSSSIGRSLQKTPVSMKRSISSSAKIFSSFRGSKSQASSTVRL